ncbi:MAG: glutamate--tRNA ligase family protein, partial [Patescibacteria group bacterium]
HLANIVDDHLMKVNLVIRGEEWLPSTPKHVFLYQCFGWDIPEFAHIPLILNPDKSKLSKRQGDVAVEDYLAKGYLPEALLNFVAFLGWNPGGEREIFSLQELITEFSLDRVRKSGSVFDIQKLDWINGQYIRQLDLEKLTQLCLPYLKQKGIDVDLDLAKKIVWLEQERLVHLDEVGDKTMFLVNDELDYAPEILVWKKADKADAIKNLTLAHEKLSGLKYFTLENISQILLPIAQEVGVGNFMWPLRVALTGQQSSPGPFEVASTLGQEKSLARIKKAIDLLI